MLVNVKVTGGLKESSVCVLPAVVREPVPYNLSGRNVCVSAVPDSKYLNVPRCQ